MQELLIFGVCFGVAFINYMMGYDAGHDDGFVEGTKELVNAGYKIRELENELQVCRVNSYILRRKYNDLMRKIKAMEGVL